MWVYTPATVKLASGSDHSLVSGVYITKGDAEFLLTLASEDRITSFKSDPVSAAVVTSVGDSSIDWETAEFVASAPLTNVEKFLAPLRADFAIVPHSTPHIVVLKFKAANPERQNKVAREFSVQTDSAVLPHRAVRLESSPYSGVNAALFMGYMSQGVISYVATGAPALDVDGVATKRGPPAEAIFVDARFLEGMEGGLVSLEVAGQRLGPSIGLIAGQLAKQGGEGKLTLVVPWSQIIQATANVPELKLLATCLQQAAKAGGGPRPWGEITRNKSSGICVVQSRLRGGRKTWGSGVIISPELILTNQHVVGDTLGVEVWLEKYNRRSVQWISHSLEGIDLVFLRLTKKLPGKFEPVKLAPTDAKPGTPVFSVGFGLFYPERLGPALQPLYSQGLIANTGRAQVLADASDQGPSMLVSTAGCWNGSSGGGIFNQSRELVGIMASNAKDDVTGEIMPDLSFVIPVHVIRQALDLLTSAERAHTSEQFQTLWKLQKTHRDRAKL